MFSVPKSNFLLLRQGVLEPEFYGDLVSRFRNIVGGSGFSEQFEGLVDRCGGIGYGLGVVWRAACLVVGAVVVGGCASLFGCTAAVRMSGTLAAFSWGFGQWVGAWRCAFGLASRGSAVGFRFTLVCGGVSHECSSLFVVVIGLFFVFRFGALTELGAFMRTKFLCISILRVASGPRVRLAGCESALGSLVVCSASRSWAVVLVLVLLFVALWFILRGGLFCVLSCVILFLCFSVLLALRLPRLGRRQLILVRFVRLFDLCLFDFVGFLFLFVSRNGCSLWLWHSLEFSLIFFAIVFWFKTLKYLHVYILLWIVKLAWHVFSLRKKMAKKKKKKQSW